MTPKQLLQQLVAEKYKALDGNADKLIDWLLDELLATSDKYAQALKDYAAATTAQLSQQRQELTDETQVAAAQANLDAQIATLNATISTLG